MPESQERDFEEDKNRGDSSGVAKPTSEEEVGKSSEENLMETLDYFRQQPVPAKKGRSLWPFKKVAN